MGGKKEGGREEGGLSSQLEPQRGNIPSHLQDQVGSSRVAWCPGFGWGHGWRKPTATSAGLQPPDPMASAATTPNPAQPGTCCSTPPKPQAPLGGNTAPPPVGAEPPLSPWPCQDAHTGSGRWLSGWSAGPQTRVTGSVLGQGMCPVWLGPGHRLATNRQKTKLQGRQASPRPLDSPGERQPWPSGYRGLLEWRLMALIFT